MLVLIILIHICSTRNLCSRKLGLWSVLGTPWLCKVDGIFAVSKLMKVHVYFEWPRGSDMKAWDDILFSQFYCFLLFAYTLYLQEKGCDMQRYVLPPSLRCFHLYAWDKFYQSDLLHFSIQGLGFPVLVIPWQVLQELDILKDQGRVKNNLLAARARRAISFLHSNFTSQHPRVRGKVSVLGL